MRGRPRPLGGKLGTGGLVGECSLRGGDGAAGRTHGDRGDGGYCGWRWLGEGRAPDIIGDRGTSSTYTIFSFLCLCFLSEEAGLFSPNRLAAPLVHMPEALLLCFPWLLSLFGASAEWPGDIELRGVGKVGWFNIYWVESSS